MSQIRPDLREKLKDKLIIYVSHVDELNDQKKHHVQSYGEMIKAAKKKSEVIAKALKENNEEVLVNYFGGEWREVLLGNPAAYFPRAVED